MTEEIYERNKPGLVRSLALGVATAGALGSLAFTLQAGGQNVSVIRMLLFSVWVLSPFILLIIFCMRSGSWSSRSRISLYVIMMMISLISLLFYGGLLFFSGAKPAFVFQVIPLTSWIISLTVYTYLRR
jgi:hypothetical protein